MYSLPYFKESDPQKVFAYMKANPFAFVAGCDAAGKPVATQLPLLIAERDGQQFLSGHLMRSTDHHKAFAASPSVLCVFSGAHTYVSASWYANPHQASTWNYQSVHVRGTLRFLDDDGLVDVLRRTTLHFEGGDTASPTTFDNLPTEYTARLMKAIVAFEVAVESIENVFKLSQNRDRESYRNIVSHLAEGDASAKVIANEMANREAALYDHQPPDTSAQ